MNRTAYAYYQSQSYASSKTAMRMSRNANAHYGTKQCALSRLLMRITRANNAHYPERDLENAKLAPRECLAVTSRLPRSYLAVTSRLPRALGIKGKSDLTQPYHPITCLCQQIRACFSRVRTHCTYTRLFLHVGDFISPHAWGC